MGSVFVLIKRWIKFGFSEGMAHSYSELFDRIRTFYNQASDGSMPNHRLAKLVLFAGAITIMSVMVGDTIASQPCRQACKEQGWKAGRLRGNPHVVEKSHKYQCWCYRGDEWSDEPVQYSD